MSGLYISVTLIGLPHFLVLGLVWSDNKVIDVPEPF